MGGDAWYRSKRLGGLRRFAVAITVLNILGHVFFGFEQAWVHPLAALLTAYLLEIFLEIVDAGLNRRPYYFAGGVIKFVDFLLPAHITALAVAMLLYSNERVAPLAFATAVAIGSKGIFRLPASGRHFLNPSNLGITVTLLLFPWVGIAPPYHFTENLIGIGDWLLPMLIVISGTIVNGRFTQRLPLIAAWLIGFAAQALLRSLFFDTPVTAGLMPMTGVAFILYTFYMITDPATTPAAPSAQLAFGLAVAGVYGLLLVWHIVFGLFFALTIVCAVRGLVLYVNALVAAHLRAGAPIRSPILGREA